MFCRERERKQEEGGEEVRGGGETEGETEREGGEGESGEGERGECERNGARDIERYRESEREMRERDGG